jgi:hypothetical protein
MSICLDGDEWQLRGCLGRSGTGTRDRRRVIRPAGSSAQREQGTLHEGEDDVPAHHPCR